MKTLLRRCGLTVGLLLLLGVVGSVATRAMGQGRAAVASSESEARVAALEKRIAALEAQLKELRDMLQKSYTAAPSADAGSSPGALLGGLAARIQREIDVNPNLQPNGITVKLVEEKNGYVTLSVQGVDWSGPGWDAKNGIRRGTESFGMTTLYWGSRQASTVANLEQVIRSLAGMRQIKWQILDPEPTARASTSTPSTTAPSLVREAVGSVSDSPCSAEGQKRSTTAEGKTNFTIVNQRSDSITVFWLDYDGSRKRWFDVAPRSRMAQEGTYATHPWLVSDRAGKCLRIFSVQANSKPEIVIR